MREFTPLLHQCEISREKLHPLEYAGTSLNNSFKMTSTFDRLGAIPGFPETIIACLHAKTDWSVVEVVGDTEKTEFLPVKSCYTPYR